MRLSRYLRSIQKLTVVKKQTHLHSRENGRLQGYESLKAEIEDNISEQPGGSRTGALWLS